MLVTVSAEDGGWPEAEQRALSELRALGFDAEIASTPSLSDCTDDLETRRGIAEQRALAGLEIRRLGPDGRSVRLCVVDRVTGKAMGRRLDPAGAWSGDQVALLAVELVHASLLEIRAGHPSRGEVPAPPLVARAVDRRLSPFRPADLGVRLGVGVLFLPPDASPGVGPMVGLTLRPFPFFLLDAEGSLTALGSSVREEEGRSRVISGLGRIHALGAYGERGRVSLRAGLGGGFLLARVTSVAEPEYRVSNGIATTWLLSALLGGAVRVHDVFRIRLDAHLAWAPRPIEIAFVGRPVALLGRPLVDVALSLEWQAR